MKNVFLKILFCCLFYLFSDVEAHLITQEEFIEMERADRIADCITKAFSQKMYKNKGLVTIGTGGGAAQGSSKGLTTLAVTMECYQKANLQQARKLLLECINEYITEINKHDEFKEHAHSFPFNSENIDISILFTNKTTQEFYSPPCLAVARIMEGKLSYCISPDSNGPLQRILAETYKEAILLSK